MIRRKNEMQHLTVENSGNIKGSIVKEFLLNPEETGNRLKMCADIELAPGSMIAEHSHTDDAEIYYLLDGEAVVTDNERTEVLHAGDVVYTGNGNRHSIRNASSEPIHFLAIILA